MDVTLMLRVAAKYCMYRIAFKYINQIKAKMKEEERLIQKAKYIEQAQRQQRFERIAALRIQEEEAREKERALTQKWAESPHEMLPSISISQYDVYTRPAMAYAFFGGCILGGLVAYVVAYVMRRRNSNK